MAHNLTLADASGAAVTAEVAPDREITFREPAIATNHQGAVDWHEHAQLTRTLERERYLTSLMADPDLPTDDFVAAFAAPPLYTTSLSRGFGTLYTAVYRPRGGRVEFRWPGVTWRQSFADFREEPVEAVLTEPVAA
jgi:predicted choloylglycine hydrolase